MGARGVACHRPARGDRRLSGFRGARWWLVLGLVLVASLVPRLPILYSASFNFNSDEAVNALVVRHMLEHRDLVMYNWDAKYYGTIEGLLSIPFVLVLGHTALAFKLAAVTGFLLLVAATALLGRRLYGPAAGLVAAALVAIVSPHAVLWSTTASGGYLLVVAWGSLTALYVEWLRRREAVRPLHLGVLGLLLGLGMYIYELFVCYLLALVLWAAIALLAKARRRDPDAVARPRHLAVALATLLFAGGFALGWFPKLFVLVTAGDFGTKAPSYVAAPPEVIARNVRLFAADAMPALLGGEGDGHLEWTAPARRATTAIASLAIALHLGAWAWAVARLARRTIAGEAGVFDPEALLVTVVAVTAVLFLASSNPKNVFASRYLLPWLSALPVLTAGLLHRVWHRQRVAAAVAGAFLVLFPLVQVARAARAHGLVADDFRLVRQAEPLESVVAHLRDRGIHTAWGTYWSSYKATFLSGGQVNVAPLFDWDRNPRWRREVQMSPREAYVLEPDFPSLPTLRAHLVRRGAPMYGQVFDRYLVVSARDGGRLLSHFDLFPAPPLARPNASVIVLGSPRRVTAGQPFEMPVRVENIGTEAWSRDGLTSGAHRVVLAYRWLWPDGRALVADDGQRTLLPSDVYPGQSVDAVMRITAPAQSGHLRLLVTPLQEGVAWFDQAARVGTFESVTVVAASGDVAAP